MLSNVNVFHRGVPVFYVFSAARNSEYAPLYNCREREREREEREKERKERDREKNLYLYLGLMQFVTL
jgi:hypothetical protein